MLFNRCTFSQVTVILAGILKLIGQAVNSTQCCVNIIECRNHRGRQFIGTIGQVLQLFIQAAHITHGIVQSRQILVHRISGRYTVYDLITENLALSDIAHNVLQRIGYLIGGQAAVIRLEAGTIFLVRNLKFGTPLTVFIKLAAHSGFNVAGK